MLVQSQLKIKTNARQALDISTLVNTQIAKAQVKTGLCHIFSAHTSVALMIAPNSDVNVLLDIENYLQKIIPENGNYRHHNYPGDMSGHLRALLLGCEKTIAITNDKLALGQLQSLYLYEFQHTDNNERQVILTINA